MQTASPKVSFGVLPKPLLDTHDISFDRVAYWLTFVAVLIATLMITSTYRVFNQTWDEPAHIACGMEWLDKGEFHYETLHPPVARVAVALGPYFAGLRSHGAESMWVEGNLILATNGQYQRNLTLARLGVLPFFWLCCSLIWYLTQKFVGPACALTSVFLFTTIPTVLAHASLATTDMPVTAMFLLAITAWLRWRAEPTGANSICLGMAIGLAFVTKFSSIPFLGLTLALAIAINRPTLREIRSLTRKVLVICSAAMLTIWAAYRFSIGPLLLPATTQRRLNHIFGQSGHLRDAGYFVLTHLPAPEFFRGIWVMLWHNSAGRTAYFLGHVSLTGHWYFFPVLLATKLPIPILLLIAIGTTRTLFHQRDAHREFLILVLLAIICPLFVACLSSINIGLRHVLVIMPFLAILAGIGASELRASVNMNKIRLGQIGVVTLLICNAATCWSATPDFLPYFNELSRQHASSIVSDSDIDWGQDLSRLSNAVGKRKDISHLFIAYNGSADLSEFALPPWSKLPTSGQCKGWIAISLDELKLHPNLYGWLESQRPVQVVGKSILLYHIE